MKNIKWMSMLLIAMLVFVGGCSKSTHVTKYDEVAVDTLYEKNQCPCFEHEFEFNGKKYTTNDVQKTSIVMPLKELTLSLSANTTARETFNETVRKMNKPVLVKDISKSPHRVVKKVFIQQKCPSYYYSPAFKAKKLTPSFVPTDNTTFVVIPMDNMMFQLEKHKKTKAIFNDSVKKINLTVE